MFKFHSLFQVVKSLPLKIIIKTYALFFYPLWLSVIVTDRNVWRVGEWESSRQKGMKGGRGREWKKRIGKELLSIYLSYDRLLNIAN